MTPEDFWPRFRSQFDDNEWSKLIRDGEFKKALLSLDAENIPTIAAKILIRDGKTKEEARRLKEYYEKYGKHHTF